MISKTDAQRAAETLISMCTDFLMGGLSQDVFASNLTLFAQRLDPKAAHAIDQHEKLKAELDEWRNMAAVLCGDGGQCHADYGTAATRAYIEKRMFDLRDQHEKLMELAQLCYDVIEDDLEERPARHSLGNLSARLRTLLREEKNEYDHRTKL